MWEFLVPGCALASPGCDSQGSESAVRADMELANFGMDSIVYFKTHMGTFQAKSGKLDQKGNN